ncbi:hypothetical protein DL93DRAFT_2086853 [Clavulina sp. PMI_390]|nr:hypothetical protein DL93DRAFT_2086853 [Clavulina sp. PMI_390]
MIPIPGVSDSLSLMEADERPLRTTGLVEVPSEATDDDNLQSEHQTSSRPSLLRLSDTQAELSPLEELRLLKAQVQDLTRVCQAVASGDLSQRVTIPVEDKAMVQLKDAINDIVTQSSQAVSEVTRLVVEIGSGGTLGGSTTAMGVEYKGSWNDLIVNATHMSQNLTKQIRSIFYVIKAISAGNFETLIDVEAQGEMLELKLLVNSMVSQFSEFTHEVTRVSREIGTDGYFGGQVIVQDLDGMWKIAAENVNTMASNLTSHVRETAQVTMAVARGDLTMQMTSDMRGEWLDSKMVVNEMVRTLRMFSAEVNRVTHEGRVECNLGGQATVPDITGTWKDLSDDVNTMAFNFTHLVRTISASISAVARGDLTHKIEGSVQVSGETLQLYTTINAMIDDMNYVAQGVKRVTKEVGTKGNLGGQADTENLRGSWLDIASSVNIMTFNLTGQLRNFAEASAAASIGDYSKLITVEASGEIAILKDQINFLIKTLRDKA